MNDQDRSLAQHPTGHPVAWRWKRHAGERDWLVTDVKPFPREGRLIEPLYTASLTPAEGEHDPVAFRERLIQDLEAENDRLRAQVENARALYEAADRVCWFDWSDNDRDAAHAIEDLRGALRRASALSHTSTNGQPNG